MDVASVGWVGIVWFCIDMVHTQNKICRMDVHYHLNGTHFVWNDRKAASNRSKHDGVSFE